MALVSTMAPTTTHSSFDEAVSPGSATETTRTTTILSGMKRPVLEAEEASNRPADIHMPSAELVASVKSGDASPETQQSAKRIRPTREGVRRGKWTAEEQRYADRLISDFEAGLLPLENGATLRAFLSMKLNCDPMRISKKFAGARCLGKQIFLKKSAESVVDDGMSVDGVPVDAPVMTAENIRQREEELQCLEADFLRSITVVATTTSRRRNRNAAAKKKGTAAAAADPATATATTVACVAVPQDDELVHDSLTHGDGFGLEMASFAGLMSKSPPSSVPMHATFSAIASSSESDDQGLTSHDDNSDSDDNTDGIALPAYMAMPKLELNDSSYKDLCYQGQRTSGMPRLCYDSDTESPAEIHEAMGSLTSMPMSALGSDSRRGVSSMVMMGDDLSSTLTFLPGDVHDHEHEYERHLRGSQQPDHLVEQLGDFLPDECFMMEPL